MYIEKKHSTLYLGEKYYTHIIDSFIITGYAFITSDLMTNFL